MRNMKRCLVFVLLCFIASVPLSAKDFVVTGYGESIREARKDALEALSLSISSSVSTLVMTSTYDDGESISQRYGDSSLHSSDFDPVGMEFGKAQENDGLWSITVTLPSSSAPLYYNRLGEKADEIERLYNSMGRLSNLGEVSYDELDQLSDLLASFEVDRIVATGLDREGVVPELPVSRSQVEVQRNAKLQAEEESLEGMLDTYDVAEVFGLLTDEMEADRRELSRRLADLRADSQARIEEMDARTRDLLEELGASGASVTKEKQGEDEEASRIVENLDKLVLRRSGNESVRSSVSQSIRQLNKAYAEEVDSFVEENMDRKWPFISLGTDGRPTAEAVKERREGLEYAAVEQFSPSYAASMTGQVDMALELMSNGLEEMASLVEEIMDSELTLTSEGSILSVSIDGAQDDALAGTMHMRLAGRDIGIDFSIPFESWMGEPMPDPSTQIFEYEDYLFVVSQWLSMLMDNSGLMRVDLKCSFAYDPILYCVYLVPESYAVTRLDTDETVVELDISDDGETRYDRLLSLPFNLERAAFNFSFGTIDPDLVAAGFDPQKMVDDVIDEYDLAKKLDIANLDLDGLDDDVLRALRGLSTEERVDISRGDVKSVEKRVERAEDEKAKADYGRRTTSVKKDFFGASVILEPYVSGVGRLASPQEGSNWLTASGEFSLGFGAYYKLGNKGDAAEDLVGSFSLYVGAHADFSYEHVLESWSAGNGTAGDDGLPFGGSIGFDIMYLSRFASFAIKADLFGGLGFYSPSGLHDGMEAVMGASVGFLIPAGGGKFDLSARFNASFPLDGKSSQGADAGSLPLFLSAGMSVGYAFSI